MSLQTSKSNFIIAPSILSADFARLGEQVKRVVRAGADWIHFDVMDNHYVPNLSFGPMVCQALRDYGIDKPIDVHLMTQPVDELIRAFAACGASCITVHPDATRHIDRSLQLIKDSGCLAGLALNPAIGMESLRYELEKLDIILIMSVNPGFGGQSFIPAVMDKIRQTRQFIDDSGRSIRLQVDGGINPQNIGEIALAGADTFVAGSSIFGARSMVTAIRSMRRELAAIAKERC